jgi:hypothetical protein
LHEAGPSPRPQITILHSIYTPEYKLRVPAHTQFSQIDVDRKSHLSANRGYQQFCKESRRNVIIGESGRVRSLAVSCSEGVLLYTTALRLHNSKPRT